MAALAGYGWWTDFTRVSAVPIVIVVALAALAEVAEFLLGGRYARKYGGGRRAGYGAVLGGIVGAVLGLPIPLLGSVFGALLGSFAGAMLLELTTGRGTGVAARAGWGALIGRVVATAMKAAVGVVIAVFTLFVALR